MTINIKLNNIKLYGYHGLGKYEKEIGQPFEIDVITKCNININNDKIENTLDYSILYSDVKRIFFSKKYNLIESLAHQIVSELKEKYKLKEIIVKIRKPNAPIDGRFDNVEVEVNSNEL